MAGARACFADGLRIRFLTLISWTTAVATDHLNGWIFNDLHGLFGPRKTFSDLQCFLLFFAHVRQLLDGPAIGAVWQMAAKDMCIQHVSRYTSLVFAAALANCLFALQAGIGLFLWHVSLSFRIVTLDNAWPISLTYVKNHT